MRKVRGWKTNRSTTGISVHNLATHRVNAAQKDVRVGDITGLEQRTHQRRRNTTCSIGTDVVDHVHGEPGFAVAETEGEREQEAMDALLALIADKFGEGE